MGEVVGLKPEHWKTTDPIRTICKRAFEAAGVIYFSPHTFRSTLVLLAQERCRAPAELKAWSQNLGHDHLLTTLTSYGALPEATQAELVAKLDGRVDEPISPELRQVAEQLINRIRNERRQDEMNSGTLL
jgi:integrase/recombinase XerD